MDWASHRYLPNIIYKYESFNWSLDIFLMNVRRGSRPPLFALWLCKKLLGLGWSICPPGPRAIPDPRILQSSTQHFLLYGNSHHHVLEHLDGEKLFNLERWRSFSSEMQVYLQERLRLSYSSREEENFAFHFYMARATCVIESIFFISFLVS
jgi:hypothetical protein